MIVPITRKEKLLNAIATNGNVDFLPKTREELFLFKILGADVNTPAPITRKEILYQHIIDGTLPTFEPRTRLEKFIMAAAGVELELPAVLTREEYWWAEISDSAYETITGAIVHFISKRARAIKSLIANISYTQDLNGYDSPWPAGGGKNLLWLNNGVFKTGGFRENRQLTGIGTWVGMSSSNYLAPDNIVSYTIGDNSLTVKSKANGYGVGFECKLTAGQKYTLSWVGTNVYVGIAFYDGDGASLSYVTSGASPKTFTVPESTANAIIVLRGDNANVTGEFSNVQLEEGQTATAYSPYSNICPITGYDNVTLKQSNHNIWAFDASYSPSGYAVLVPRNTEFYLPAGTYTFSAIPDIESSSVVLGGYYADDTQVTLARLNASEERQSATFTIARPLHKMYLIANKGGTISDIQLEVGDTDTGFEAASISTINVSLTSGDNTSTVYGGTLDVTTGVLTVNKVALMFNGSEDWASVTANGHTRQRVNSVLIGIKQITGGGQTPNLISDRYPTKTPNATYAGTVGITNQQNSADLYIMDNRYDYVDSASDYKTWLSTNNLKVVYELAEPVTYQLTPTEVATLLGDNTIWADTGDVSVTY